MLDCPLISPLPHSPEHMQHDSTDQDNRSLSGPLEATDQYTVEHEPASQQALSITDSRNISAEILEAPYRGPDSSFIMFKDGDTNSPSSLTIRVRLSRPVALVMSMLMFLKAFDICIIIEKNGNGLYNHDTKSLYAQDKSKSKGTSLFFISKS